VSKQDIEELSIAELRKLITAAGLSFADCLEKPELQARAKDARRLLELESRVGDRPKAEESKTPEADAPKEAAKATDEDSDDAWGDWQGKGKKDEAAAAPKTAAEESDDEWGGWTAAGTKSDEKEKPKPKPKSEPVIGAWMSEALKGNKGRQDGKGEGGKGKGKENGKAAKGGKSSGKGPPQSKAERKKDKKWKAPFQFPVGPMPKAMPNGQGPRPNGKGPGPPKQPKAPPPPHLRRPPGPPTPFSVFHPASVPGMPPFMRPVHPGMATPGVWAAPAPMPGVPPAAAPFGFGPLRPGFSAPPAKTKPTSTPAKTKSTSTLKRRSRSRSDSSYSSSSSSRPRKRRRKEPSKRKRTAKPSSKKPEVSASARAFKVATASIGKVAVAKARPTDKVRPSSSSNGTVHNSELKCWLEGLEKGTAELMQYLAPLQAKYRSLDEVLAASMLEECQSGTWLANVRPSFWEELGVTKLGEKLSLAKGLCLARKERPKKATDGTLSLSERFEQLVEGDPDLSDEDDKVPVLGVKPQPKSKAAAHPGSSAQKANSLAEFRERLRQKKGELPRPESASEAAEDGDHLQVPGTLSDRDEFAEAAADGTAGMYLETAENNADAEEVKLEDAGDFEEYAENEFEEEEYAGAYVEHDENEEIELMQDEYGGGMMEDANGEHAKHQDETFADSEYLNEGEGEYAEYGEDNAEIAEYGEEDEEFKEEAYHDEQEAADTEGDYEPYEEEAAAHTVMPPVLKPVSKTMPKRKPSAPAAAPPAHLLAKAAARSTAYKRLRM